MPVEPLPSASTPTEQQIEQQLQRFDRHPLMGGLHRLDALRWLIEFKRRGMHDPKRNPNLCATNLPSFMSMSASAFLNRKTRKHRMTWKSKIVDRGKALFGGLAHALEAYYAERGPGANDPIRITLRRGHGRFYEPLIQLNSTAPIPKPVSTETADYHNGVISDADLIRGIEAKVPDATTDIWVVAPDLSNVGDETSPFSELVRRTVCENARRGGDYTYLCPKGHAGHSRIQRLAGCFIGTTGTLHLHQVPPERFYEITLVQAHFISFNPLSPAPDAYMQLPLCQAQKGWIKLSRKDAARILAKMKRLIAEYPAEKIDVEEPAAL